MNDNSLLRSILLHLDDSSSGVAAIELAIAWANRFSSLLVGMGVVDEPAIHGPRPQLPVSPSYLAAYGQLLEQARHATEQRLDRFSKRCIEAGIAYKLLEDTGSPGEQLLLEAQRYDLLLIGQSADLGMAAVGGKESLPHLLRYAGRPVVVVPALATVGGSVTVAYDGSPAAACALQAFAATGLAWLGQVHVVTIDQESPVRAAKTADRAIEFLRFHNIAAESVPLAGPPNCQTLIETARRLESGLLVMGACGHSAVREFFLGSTTRSVLRESGVPLFLYH